MELCELDEKYLSICTKIFDLYSVTSVVTTLTPGHHVHLLAQEVHQLPLALVAPLGPQDHRHRHDDGVKKTDPRLTPPPTTLKCQDSFVL